MKLLLLNPLRRLGYTALLTLPSVVALAQRPAYTSGYVVLAAAPTDTLRGEVDLSSAGRVLQPQVRFRTGSTEAFRSYGLSDLLAAGSPSGRQFRRCQVPNRDAVLLEVLVAGFASLYYDPTNQLPARYYLDKRDQALTPLSRHQFQEVLQTYFADCPTLNTTVAYAGQYVYSADDLRRYVLNYNRCAHPQLPVQAAPAPPERKSVRWVVQAGAAQVQFFYPYRTRRQAVAGGPVPTGSLGLEVPFNRHFGLVTGVTVTSLRADNTVSQLVPTTDYVQTMRYRTKGALLRLPISLRYTLRAPDARWRPYAQLGGHFSQIVRGRLHWNNSYAGAPMPDQEFDLYYGGIGSGVQAEAGLVLHRGAHRFGAGLRYEQTYGFPNTGRSFLVDLNQLSLALTYYH